MHPSSEILVEQFFHSHSYPFKYRQHLRSHVCPDLSLAAPIAPLAFFQWHLQNHTWKKSAGGCKQGQRQTKTRHNKRCAEREAAASAKAGPLAGKKPLSPKVTVATAAKGTPPPDPSVRVPKKPGSLGAKATYNT